MGLLELLNWKDSSQKSSSSDEITINGSGNTLNVASQHLSNQTEIEIGLEVLIVMLFVIMVFYVAKNIIKKVKKQKKINKAKKLDRLRKVLSVEEAV